MAEPTTLLVPPFPPLTWDDCIWTGEVVLPVWAGFQDRSGPYCSPGVGSLSDGKVQLNVHTADAERVPPTRAQCDAYNLLTENQGEVRDAVVRALGAWLRGRKRRPVSDADVRCAVGLGIVHVTAWERDGLAFVGYELGCDWDEEHGAGAFTHGTTVLEVGQADVAFDPRDTDVDDEG